MVLLLLHFLFRLDEGQNEVLKSGEVRKILEKLKVIAEIPDGESHSQKLPAAAYGCVTNLTCDNCK